MTPRALASALAVLAGCGASPGANPGANPGDNTLDAAADGPRACDYADAAARPDGRVVGGPFATRVVTVTYGAGAGFGADQMPDIALGPPVGAGDLRGSTDVVSLGARGEIVLALDDIGIVDGPGADFVVFENPFEYGAGRYYEELGEVAVSEDGVRWQTFACDARGPRPHTGCAGWHPVYSAPGNGFCADDPAVAGGDPFDLHDVGVPRARFVRVRDLGTLAPSPPTTGFDLDAVAVVHGERLR